MSNSLGRRTFVNTPAREPDQRTPYYFDGQHRSLELTVSKQLGPVAVHWLAEVANTAEGEAVLELNTTEAAFNRRFQEDHDKYLAAIAEAERDSPDRIAAFLAKLRERSFENDLPPDGPVEYDVREDQISPRAQAAIQQIEQGEE